MAIDNRAERQEQAERLREARIKAGFKSVRAGAEAARVDLNAYKQHEAGRNGFNTSHARIYGRAFKVSPIWLVFGDGERPEIAAEALDAALVETPAEYKSADGEGLTIAEAKQRLARSLGVDPSSIKIIIEA
jgi:hypothetical protein